jgi:hypothetical protein
VNSSLERLLRLGQALLQLFHVPHRAGLGLGQRLELSLEPLAALRERLLAALQVREVRLFELQGVLGLRERRARRVQMLLRGAECLLGLRQAGFLGVQAAPRLRDALFGFPRLHRPSVQ